MKKFLLIVPLCMLIIICMFFLLYILFEKNPNNPPSALLNKNLPLFNSSNLYDNKEILYSKNLKGKTILINFFASWCTPCRAEHHLFFKIKKYLTDIIQNSEGNIIKATNSVNEHFKMKIVNKSINGEICNLPIT